MYCTDHMVNFLYKVACIFANLFHYFQIILIAGIHIVLTFRPGQTGLNVGIIDYLGHLPLPLSLNLKFIFVLSANVEARKGSKQKLRTYLTKFVLEFSFFLQLRVQNLQLLKYTVRSKSFYPIVCLLIRRVVILQGFLTLKCVLNFKGL